MERVGQVEGTGRRGDAWAGESRLLWGGLCWVGWVSQVLGASLPPGDPSGSRRVHSYEESLATLSTRGCSGARDGSATITEDSVHLLTEAVTLRLEHRKGSLASAGRWGEGLHPHTDLGQRGVPTPGRGVGRPGVRKPQEAPAISPQPPAFLGRTWA